MARWIVERFPGAVITRPLDDIIEHSPFECCSCVPKVSYIGDTCYCTTPTLVLVKEIVHNAMDGRVNDC